MKKSSKRFTITSEALNASGFKVRTAGIDLTDFKQNPLLLFMHKRPTGERTDEVLPLGYWDDIQVADGKITGVPVFDDTDPFALKIYNKVENGTIKMASAGLQPLEFAETNGEKWLEKAILKEGSICDIGQNKEALSVALYDDNDTIVTLSEVYDKKLQTPKTPDMKTINLAAATTLPLLKLSENATEVEVHTALLNLVTLSETQKTKIEELEGKNKDLQKKIDDAATADQKQKCITLAEEAVTARKITADQKPFIIKLAESDYGNAKAYVDSLKAAPDVNTQINTNGKKADELLKLSWDELDKSNQLVTLKEANLEAFKEKYKAKYGKEFVEA